MPFTLHVAKILPGTGRWQSQQATLLVEREIRLGLTEGGELSAGAALSERWAPSVRFAATSPFRVRI